MRKIVGWICVILVFAMFVGLIAGMRGGIDFELPSFDENDSGGRKPNPGDTSALTYSLNDDGESYTVTGLGTWKGSTLVIPEEYEGLPVTEIAPYAFSGELKSYTKAVEIPSSVEVIGDGAFKDCVYVESVKLGSVKNIGANAFANTKIVELRFSVEPGTVIGKNAFATSTLKRIFVLESDTAMMTDSPSFSEWGCSEATLYNNWYECLDNSTSVINGWYEFKDVLATPTENVDVFVEYSVGEQSGNTIRIQQGGYVWGVGFCWNSVFNMWDPAPSGSIYFNNQTVPTKFYTWLLENGTFSSEAPELDQNLGFELNEDGVSYSLNMNNSSMGPQNPDSNGFYTIPDVYEGLPVTGIKVGNIGGGPVKYYVADSVQTIYANAFFTVDNESVELVFSANSKLKTIENNAFYGFVIDSLSLPGSVESIGSTAFSSCTINTLNLPFAEGEISGAPWGATVATVNYSQASEEPYTVYVGDMYFTFDDWILDDGGFKDLKTTYRFNNVEYSSLTLDFTWMGKRIHFHPDAKLPESAFLWMTKHGEFDVLPVGAVNYGATEGLEIVLEGDYDPDYGYDFREAYVVGLGSYSGNSLVIPEKYEGYTVVGIRDIGFAGGSVVIPSNVRTISGGAFVGTGVASTLNVVMDEKISALYTIESGAFVNLHIPYLYLRYVNELGELAFDGCTINELDVPFHQGSFTDEPWGATITTINYRGEFVLLKGSYTFNETLTMHPVTSENSVYFDFKYDGVSYTSLSLNHSYFLYMGYNKVYFPYNFVFGSWEDESVSRTIEFVDRSGKGYGTWLGDIEFFEWLCENGTFSEGPVKQPDPMVAVFGEYIFSPTEVLSMYPGNVFEININFTYKGVSYSSMRFDSYLYFDEFIFPYNFVVGMWDGGSSGDSIQFGEDPQAMPQEVYDWFAANGQFNDVVAAQSVSVMSLDRSAPAEATETISFDSTESSESVSGGDQLNEATDTDTGWSEIYQ